MHDHSQRALNQSAEPEVRPRVMPPFGSKVRTSRGGNRWWEVAYGGYNYVQVRAQTTESVRDAQSGVFKAYWQKGEESA